MNLVASNGNFHINASLNVDVGDLPDNFSRRLQIQDSLVDTHLEAIIGVGTLTARRLSGHDPQDLGGHAHRARDLELAINSSCLQFRAHYTKNKTLFSKLNPKLFILQYTKLVSHLSQVRRPFLKSR